MSQNGEAVVVGGTGGIGRAIAEALVARGDSAVIVGRDLDRATTVATEIGPACRGLALDVGDAAGCVSALADVGDITHVVLTAIEVNSNTLESFDVAAANRLAAIKLTGYTAVIAALAPRLRSTGSVLLFGGNSKDKPFPGSTTVTAVNGAIAALTRALVVELAPRRVNALHPGIVADSPAWREQPTEFFDFVRESTPTKELVEMVDVVEASLFLLDSRAISGVNLSVDGGASLV